MGLKRLLVVLVSLLWVVPGSAARAASMGCVFYSSPANGVPVIWASDGTCLAAQPSSVIASYEREYGNGAAWHWAADHDASLNSTRLPSCFDGSTLNCMPPDVQPPGETSPCQFVLGFKVLHDQIAEVGACLDNERPDPKGNGNRIQHSVGGLLVWRKQDNWTAFTDGYWTWVNGPQGIQRRLNSERFPWEGNPAQPAGQSALGGPASGAVTNLQVLWAGHGTVGFQVALGWTAPHDVDLYAIYVYGAQGLYNVSGPAGLYGLMNPAFVGPSPLCRGVTPNPQPTHPAGCLVSASIAGDLGPLRGLAVRLPAVINAGEIVSGLVPGSYVFFLKARDARGIWQPQDFFYGTEVGPVTFTAD